MGNYSLFGILCSKDYKKIELLAFTNKIKIIKSYVPEKVKLYIETKLLKEIEYFEKKVFFKDKFYGRC